MNDSGETRLRREESARISRGLSSQELRAFSKGGLCEEILEAQLTQGGGLVGETYALLHAALSQGGFAPFSLQV